MGEVQRIEAGQTGATGSQRASRSGLVNRGTGAMSPSALTESDFNFAP